MIQILILVMLVAILLLLLWQNFRGNQRDQSTLIAQQFEEKHRAMLLDVNDGLNKLGDRLSASSNEASERLRASVATELQATRDAMQALQLAQNNSLSLTRETVLEKLHTTLSEQGKSQQALINDTMLKATTTLPQARFQIKRLARSINTIVQP